MYDYQLKFKNLRGEVVLDITYQQLITKLMVREEMLHGAPLKEGGTPQVATLSEMVRKNMGAASVDVYFNGNQIL